MEIEIIDGEIKIPHDTMSECYRKGISMADERAAASVFLTPDLVFSDGSFTTLQRLAFEGKRVVYVMGIRVIKQGASVSLRERFRVGSSICIGPRDLMGIALKNLHPLGVSSFWEEGEDDLIPANLYWRAGEAGIVARCFHLHPLLVFPERKHATFFGTVDDDYVPASCPDPSGDHVVSDSDQLLAVELSDVRRHFLTGIRKGSFVDVAFWAEMAANSRHRSLIDVRIRLHTGWVDERSWKETEYRSDEVVSKIQSLLRRTDLRLLLSRPQTLERRMVLRAQERRLELANGRKPFTGQGEEGVTRRWLLAIKAYSPFQDAIWLYGLYSKTIPRALRAVKSFREAILGSPVSPNILNVSWIYVRQLAKDVRDTVKELDSDLVVCGDPENSLVARVSREEGVRAFSLVLAEDGDGTRRLYDVKSGKVLADQSVNSVLMDLALRRCDEIGEIIDAALRVLKGGGQVAIKVDRLASPVSSGATEVFLSATALCDVLRPRCEIMSRRLQGGIGTVVAMTLGSYAKLQISRLGVPLILWPVLALVRMPVEIALGVTLNLLGTALNLIDTTDRNYVSCVVTARKGEKSNGARCSEC